MTTAKDPEPNDPRTRQRDGRPTTGDKEGTPERRRRKSKPVVQSPSRVVPSQGRTEVREQPPDLQDIERDVVGGNEPERHNIERE